jgi:uncharacterized membrane protein YeaQ/YmgE (transglycosylase-associated protein family)
MNGILWLFSGALVGLAMSLIMRPDANRDVVFNIWVAVVGATIGGWLLSPLIGAPGISEQGFGSASLLASMLGALILFVILRLVRRRLTQL